MVLASMKMLRGFRSVWGVGLLFFFVVSFVFGDDFVESAVVDGLLDVFEVCDVYDAGFVPVEPFPVRFEDCVVGVFIPVPIVPGDVFPEGYRLVACFG